MDLKEIVKEVESASGSKCNCDLDNWQPERSTNHSWVCRIHKIALERYRNQKRTPTNER